MRYLVILNDIANVVDCEHKTAPTEKTGYPSIRTPNIGRGRLILEGVNRVSKKTYDLWARRAIPQTHDLILAREAPVGNVAIIPNGLKVCLGQRTVLIQPDRKNVNPHYLTYLLLGNEIQGRFKSVSTGATVAHLNVRDIRDLPLPELPPLETQRKIAAILSAYDDLIENNLRRIKILEEMAQRQYREWFVNFRFPGHEKVRLVDSLLGRIPEGWEVKDILELADVTYGFAFKSKQFNTEGHGMPVVRIRDVLAGVSGTDSTEKCGSRYRVKNGDILVGMDGDFHLGFWVGGNANLVQRVARFSSKGEMGRYHLFLALQEPILHFNATITGTTVAHLGHTHIKTIKIAWPTEKVLMKANSLLEPLLDELLNLRFKNQILRQTRDLLLPRLISGELDMSDLEIKTAHENEK